MSNARAWPVSVTAVGGSSCATVAWTSRGQLCITVVVKGTFAIVPGAAMTQTAPLPIVPDDEHHGGDPARSLLAASDLAPWLRQVDLWLVGHAYAPPGRPCARSAARLLLVRDGAPLLNKAIHVYGDRPNANAEPAPFQHMPLIYERALGGNDNPVGVPPGQGRQPNLLDARMRPQPAGFGPLAPRWPARRKLVRGLSPPALQALDTSAPVIPEGFDWIYFQAAPDDQRVAALRGDELLVLEGLHPKLDRVETRLPFARAQARVHGPGFEEGRPLSLWMDTLSIDADRQVCSLLWRGNFPVSEAPLAALHVVAGVELPGRPLELPRPAAAPAPAMVPPAAPPAVPPPAPKRPRVETVAFSMDQARLASTPAMPFEPRREAPAQVIAPVAVTAPAPVPITAPPALVPREQEPGFPGLPPRPALATPAPAPPAQEAEKTVPKKKKKKGRMSLGDHFLAAAEADTEQQPRENK